MRQLTVAWALVAAASCLSCTGEDPVRPAGVDAGSDAGAGGDAIAPDGGAVQDAGPDGAISDAGPIPVTPGDIVVLSGETLAAGAGDRVTEWRNAVAPMDLVARPVNTMGPTKITITLPSGANAACAAWSDGDTALSAATATALALGVEDYSVTAVVQQGPAIGVARDNGRVVASIATVNAATREYSGFALMTEYQDPQRVSKALKFATRISYAGGSAVEVVEPTLSAPGLHVVTSYRRGDALSMRVDGTAHGPVNGASNVVVPSGTPLILGSVRTDGDPDTRFAGRLCALVIHRGPETDAQITARIDALRARFMP